MTAARALYALGALLVAARRAASELRAGRGFGPLAGLARWP